MSSFYKDELPTLWKRWWLALWTGNAVALMALIFMLPPKTWMIATTISFGLMEGIGLLKKKDGYPPLTYVIRYFLPRWAAMTTIFAVWGGAAAFWLGFAHPERLAALTGLLGWLQSHFDVTYSE